MLPSLPLGNVRGTSLLDVLIQLWPYLDVYEKLAVRLCSREGLRTHDALVHTVSVHDLWGRVLPASAREIYATLRRMLARGCRPRQLVLRLHGSSAEARQARGLAVFKALEKLNGCDRRRIETSLRSVSHTYVHPDKPKTAGNDFRRYPSTGLRSGSCCMSAGSYSSGSATTSTNDSSSRTSITSSYSNDTEPNLASGRIRSGPPTQSYSGDVSTRASIIARDLDRNITSIDGTSPVTPPPAPTLRSLRVEGVPLTPRIIRTLRAAAPHLTSLKLYGYDVTADVYDIGAAASTSAAARAEVMAAAVAVGRCSVSPSAQPLSSTSSRGAVRYASRRSADDVACTAPATESHQLSPSRPPAASEPCVTVTAAAAAAPGGVPALLRQLAGSLTELTLQDCDDNTYGNSSARGGSARGRRSSHPGDDNIVADADGAIVRRGADRFDGGADGGRIPGSYGDGAAVHVGSGLSGSSNAGGAHGGGTHRGVEGLLVALRDCSRLRHLGLRHTGPNCPVLSALLTPAWGSREQRGQQPGLLDGSFNGGRSHGVGGGAGRGEGGNQAAAAAAPYLALLTRLSSLKLQSPLLSRVRPRLAAAVAQLTALTRLELGQRTAVRHVVAALLPPPAPPLPYLRDLDIACAHVTSTGTLAQLAALTALTRLSVGAVQLMLPPSPSAAAAGATAASNTRFSLSPPPHSLPLPPALQELSVAAPLPPATFLALRLPYTLRTLRMTGFSLGAVDAQTETHAGDDVIGGGGGGGLPSLMMRPEAADVLSSCVQTLQGLFAYRDLGIELHIGFQAGSGDSSNGNGGGNDTASGSGAYGGQQRRYLVAPLDRPMGHWSWATNLVPLGLQGLELAGLELSYGEVAAVARHLSSLEDLRLDSRYPLSALPHLASLRRLRRLLLNASFWQQQQQQQQQHETSHRQRLICTDAAGSLRGGVETAGEPEATATTALMRLCAAAPERLYDVALASYGRPAARFAAMQAVVGVEAALSRVGCGVLRVWVCP